MKIRDLISYDTMKDVMNAPIDAFRPFGEVQHTKDGIYIYKDIGASILAVAHLDNVNPYDHFYVNNFAGDDLVFSTRVDDRLGAYIILYVLPLMGIHTDILLTEGEETGKSTAKHFQTDKQYKWMFSFDRKGTDAVYYRYVANNWMSAMRAVFGNNIYKGAVSDIDYMAHLKCCGLNVGTGYHDEHHLLAHANMTETVKQLGKFVQFYQNNKKIWYEHEEPKPKVYAYTPPPPIIPVVPVTSVVPPAKKFNPYEDIVTDMPLDIFDYMSKDGNIIPPDKCAFCLEPIDENNTHAFMGICTECERFAVQCEECEEYYNRQIEPSEDMGNELFFGICPVCSNNWRPNAKNTGFQNTRGWWGEYDDDDQGNKDDFAG